MLALACSALVFCPGPVCGYQQPWKFMVFGDSRGNDALLPVNTDILAELAAEVVAQQPEFLLYLGDFSLSGGAEGFGLWTNAMAPVFRARVPVYPITGNHDYYSSDIIANLFGSTSPDNGPDGDKTGTYAVIHRQALVLVLNQCVPTNFYRVNQGWLEAVLATNTRPHVFAAGHMPAFKLLHTDGPHYFPENRNAFWNSLSNANARIYFAGHDHFYDHSRIDDGDGAPGNDLHQMIVGTAGAPLYGDSMYNGNNGIWTPIRAWHEAQYGYVMVNVDRDRVTTTWYHRVDTSSYAATAEVFSYSANRLPLLRHQFSEGTLTLSWTEPGILQSSPEMDGSFANVPGATSPFVVTNLAGSRVFYRLVRP